MKKTLITLAALATSTAFADWTWQGGETINNESWGTVGNWVNDQGEHPAKAPALPSSNNWQKLHISNASGTVTGLEGWAVNLDLTGGTNLTMTAGKLQGGASEPVDIAVDSTSALTLNITGGNLKGNKIFDIAGQVTLNLAAVPQTPNTNDEKANWDVTLSGNGSLTINVNTTSTSTNQLWQGLTLDLTDSSLFKASHEYGTIQTVKVIDMTGQKLGYGDVTLDSGSTLGGLQANSVETEDALVNAGDYIITTDNTGVYVTYVTPEPTTATLSLLALAGLCARRRRK